MPAASIWHLVHLRNGGSHRAERRMPWACPGGRTRGSLEDVECGDRPGPAPKVDRPDFGPKEGALGSALGDVLRPTLAIEGSRTIVWHLVDHCGARRDCRGEVFGVHGEQSFGNFRLYSVGPYCRWVRLGRALLTEDPQKSAEGRDPVDGVGPSTIRSVAKIGVGKTENRPHASLERLGSGQTLVNRTSAGRGRSPCSTSYIELPPRHTQGIPLSWRFRGSSTIAVPKVEHLIAESGAGFWGKMEQRDDTPLTCHLGSKYSQ